MGVSGRAVVRPDLIVSPMDTLCLSATGVLGPILARPAQRRATLYTASSYWDHWTQHSSANLRVGRWLQPSRAAFLTARSYWREVERAMSNGRDFSTTVMFAAQQGGEGDSQTSDNSQTSNGAEGGDGQQDQPE